MLAARLLLRRSLSALVAAFIVASLVVLLPGVAAAGSHANTTSISIPSSGAESFVAASPYPSDITVAGEQGTVLEVTVTLNDVNHTVPDDVDVLLQGPSGQTVVLMSDAGCHEDMVNVTLTFDDDAASAPPAGSAVASGTYQPSNFDEGGGTGCAGNGDSYLSPAPSGPYGSTLSVFDGTDPNGTWSLYVVDDFPSGDGGSIAGGWSVDIATLEVNSSADPGDGACDTTECTLREAITFANTTSARDEIRFNIPGIGVHTIQPGFPLPSITQPVVINGYSQPGASPNTLAVGNDAILLIEIDGTGAGTIWDPGLAITAANSVVKGLVMNRFPGAGIHVIGSAASGNHIQGNYIGILPSGIGDLFGNGDTGIILDQAPNNTVGGTTAASRNVISGNENGGVLISGSEAADNQIQGNYIGTDATGTADLGNTTDGIAIFSGPGNTIGGTVVEARNVISGNDQSGVYLESAGNVIQGNYIGTDVTGTMDVGNSSWGIRIFGSNNEIGGLSPGSGNVISGNFEGMRISGGTGQVVQGNYIGTDHTGTTALGNLSSGVILDGAKDSLVGGTVDEARNVISGNGSDGVDVFSNKHMIQGNYIGTDVTGMEALGNSRSGVAVFDSGSLIGGTVEGAGNVISGNAESGVRLNGGSNNTIRGNYIGTAATGTAPVGNGGAGVLVHAAGNSIGGTSAAGNTIAHNVGAGVDVELSDTTAVSIRRNSIFDNGGLGIDLGILVGSAGVTPNDEEDLDAGPNNFQNFPVVSSATASSGSITVRASLHSSLVTNYALLFYASPACDPSGHGEGKSFLGSVTVTTDELGNGEAAAEFATTDASLGDVVTATAIDAAGNTSEFSKCVRVTGAEPDFNGDGFADLAVGVPGEDVGTKVDAGVVNVLYGEASGLTDAGNQVWNQDSAGIAEITDTGDAFGEAVAWADFNSDGFTDLAVGVPGEDPLGQAGAGAVNVIYGSGAGLTSAGSQFLHQSSAGMQGVAEAGDAFAAALAAGDVDGDGFTDLAVGAPDEDLPEGAEVGAVNVISGSSAGLDATGSQFLTQDLGTGQAIEAGDRFGAALATGRFDADLFADVAVGTPGEEIGGKAAAGAVSVLRGTEAGVATSGNKVLHQDTPGILEVAEASDALGSSLAAGDFNGDGLADLAAGAPGETVGTTPGAGAANVMYGSSSGLTAVGDQIWHQERAGVLEVSEVDDAFGTALTSGDFDDDGHSDLAAGVPAESVGSVAGAGAVNALYGGSSGLSAQNNQLWHQDRPFVQQVSHDGDAFGGAVAAGDFDGDGHVDLAAGVPLEDQGPKVDAGVVGLLYGSPDGIQATGVDGPDDQVWNQDSTGVEEVSEADDRFGGALA